MAASCACESPLVDLTIERQRGGIAKAKQRASTGVESLQRGSRLRRPASFVTLA